MDQWIGKTALVTGASAGIGFAIAEALVKAGMNVIACARNTTTIEKLAGTLSAEMGKLQAKQVDLVHENAIMELFKEIESTAGHIDVLVNNAGVGHFDQLTTGNSTAWRDMLDLNILCTTICTRETLRLLEKKNLDHGHIININSVAGHEHIGTVSGGFNFYCGTKHMLTSLTKSMHTELTQKKSKIRVTSISPGLVNTRAIQELAKDGQLLGAFSDETISLESRDIADSVLYVLGAPPHVVVSELTIVPVGSVFS